MAEEPETWRKRKSLLHLCRASKPSRGRGARPHLYGGPGRERGTGISQVTYHRRVACVCGPSAGALPPRERHFLLEGTGEIVRLKPDLLDAFTSIDWLVTSPHGETGPPVLLERCSRVFGILATRGGSSRTIRPGSRRGTCLTLLMRSSNRCGLALGPLSQLPRSWGRVSPYFPNRPLSARL
jgi:hypothetical protein